MDLHACGSLYSAANMGAKGTKRTEAHTHVLVLGLITFLGGRGTVGLAFS
jgi:hypothetical protein